MCYVLTEWHSTLSPEPPRIYRFWPTAVGAEKAKIESARLESWEFAPNEKNKRHPQMPLVPYGTIAALGSCPQVSLSSAMA